MAANQRIRQADGILRSVPDPGSVALPKEGERNVLITSALPYCNNVPHLGNIVGSLLSADVYSRYSRTRNRRTLYICGTDEYGTATETQALKEGLSPKALCDKYHELHKETYKWFDIQFDHFGRTSAPVHTNVSQEIYLNLKTNGCLIKQEKEQTYCTQDEKFLADRFVEGTCPHCGYEDARGDQCDFCSRTLDAIELINPRCLIDKSHVIVPRKSAHMYVRLDALQPQTEAWVKQSWAKGKWSPNAVINADGELIDARLKSGLRPSPVTRDLKWGIPVPVPEDDPDQDMKGKVLYVWFDAPIGYASITADFTPQWKQWWFNPEQVQLYQFMGKDNVYFHTIYFPSIQIGDGRNWTKLHHLSTTEYLNYEGGKFSKSHNRGVFGPAAKDTGIPASVWRYYLISTRPETSDSMFSWADCVAGNNNVLLNNFGNFVNRALKFIASQYDGVIPESADAPGPLSPNDAADADFIADVNALLVEYTAAMDAVKLRQGLHTAMALSARGNLYLQSSGLGKALMTSDPARCAQVVARAANLIYVLSAVVEPFMPGTAREILSQLNAPSRSVPDVLALDILPGHQIGKPDHLFRRIDEKMADVWRDKFAGTKPAGEVQAAAQTGTTSKRKAAQAAKKQKEAKPDAGPKTPEQEAAEAKIAEQGGVVRELKARTPKTPEVEAQIAQEIEVLKKLKAELAALG